MQLTNTKNRYGFIAIFLHWLLAILFIGMLILGLYMHSLPIGIEKLKLYGLHKEFGLLVLWLVILRLFWRLANTSPTLPPPLWESIAARIVQVLFYILMFAMPLTGWLLTSSVGLPISFFGLFVMPTLIPANDGLRIVFLEIHKWLAYGLIATIILHVGAALKHHFIDKDDILRRIFS